ncbi:MAG: helix-turn-helix domain-containing protein [Chitinophagales bacterium]|nr:helix-turn-helix domain-containing protein [Chitinophagales bacterium]
MAKVRKQTEKAHAKILFIEKGWTRKDIAEKVGVSERTVGQWASKEKWEDIRAAQLVTDHNKKRNIGEAVANLSEMMLSYQRERNQLSVELDKEDDEDAKNELRVRIADLDKTIFNTSNAIAAVSKQEQRYDKDNAVSFIVYLNVMESIFNALLEDDPALHMQTVDFQETHIHEMAKKLS